MAAVDELKGSVSGPVFAQGEGGYADAVQGGWGPPAAPDVYVRPLDTDDVAAALTWAVREGLEVAVRSGGHGAWAPLPGGLLIDLASFDGVRVDDDIVQVGAGNTWGRVAGEIVGHGLAISSGDAGSVGVGGNTLGAGVGWMLRSVGLATDQLIGAEVVAVDGRVVYADATENADLFWALKGGGGNFGVVTRFDFRATRLARVVFGTSPIDTAKLADVVRGVRDAMRDAPWQLVVQLLCMPPAPGAPPPMLEAFWAGDDLAAAQAAVEPLAEVEGVGGFDLKVVRYPDTVTDPPMPPGPPPRMAGSNGVFAPLGDETVDRAAAALAQHPMTIFQVRFLGGAFGAVAADATPLAWRNAEALVAWIAMAPPGASDADLAAAEAVWDPVGEGRVSVVGTFVDGTDDAWVVEMYPPDVLHRLRAIKAEWDPGNVLHRNHNIRPA